MVSIIIPFYQPSDKSNLPYLLESIKDCLSLDYPEFEILVGVDKGGSFSFKNKKVRTFKTDKKRTGPGEKRDVGIAKAKGEYIAFLDDDSYPAKDWLKNAVEILEKDSALNAVCGPGLTPAGDNFFQRITGAILGSVFGSGPYSFRFKKGRPRFVDDYPAYNLIVKKDVLTKVGAFGTKFYGGEDTALCIKLINAGEKIFYHPSIVVFHHRRKFPLEFMKQIGNVGLHRGYFVKAYPQTSLRLSYFGPAFLTVSLPLLLFWLFFNNQIFVPLLILGGIVYTAVFIENFGKNSLLINLILPFAILFNHLVYGKQFLKGLLFTKKLIR